MFLNHLARLVTLTGIGGCGKTSLALQLASNLAPSFPRRVWVVELAAVSDPELIPVALAQALDVRGVANHALIDTITSFLAAAPTFLVLDNCEHLITDCAELAEELLRACPDLLILATSREPLRIAGERQYRVNPLAYPHDFNPANLDELSQSAAVQLFLLRAQAVVRDFQLNAENASAIFQICASLDGIPLALELAAARVRALSVEQILDRLDGSLRILAGGSRVAPTRQQALRASFDWSDALLTDEERGVFERLAVFAGTFTLKDAEAVCATGDLAKCDFLELLTRLVDQSLVVAESTERIAWYRLLEPVRQYALSHLEARGEAEAVRSRHAAHYVNSLRHIGRELHGPDQVAWMNNLERELGNLRAALGRLHGAGDVAGELTMAAALAPFWEARGYFSEGLSWLKGALAAGSTNVDPSLRARALAAAGRLTFLFESDGRSNYLDAEALHLESLTLAREIDDEHAIATALTELGLVHCLLNDFDRAAADLAGGLELFRRLEDQSGIAFTLMCMGDNTAHQGDLENATLLLEDALVRFEALRDLRFVATTRVLLSLLINEQGDIDRAVDLATGALVGHSELGDRWFISFDLTAMAIILLWAGHEEEAVRIVGATRGLDEALGSPAGRSINSELISKTRELIEDERYARAWAEGRTLSQEQVIQFCLAIRKGWTATSAEATDKQPSSGTLTGREREVAQYLMRGCTDRQIAEALYISPGTVEVHVHHILRKLGLKSRVQVAGWWASNEGI